MQLGEELTLEYSQLAQRIAVLEQSDRDTRADIAEIKLDVKSILNTLAQMSGGKKALLGLFSVLGAIVGVATALFSGWKIH